MKLVKAALVSAMLLPTSVAVAQQADGPMMQAGLTMIEASVQNALDRHSVDANVHDLSLAQLVTIVGILNDPEADSGGSSSKASIEAVLRNQ